MCFSIKVNKDSKKLSHDFNARISLKDAERNQELFSLQGKLSKHEFEKALGLAPGTGLGSFELPKDTDQRILPNYFADVITKENNERVLSSMRFRIRRNDINYEIKGIYNARIDSLDVLETWRPLFMHRHGLVPFTDFYEWVNDPEDEKKIKEAGIQVDLFGDEAKEKKVKKKLIMFSPEDREIMWAPCVWSEWKSRDERLSFKSFAIITDDPPEEVRLMGHDRCPIFLKKDNIEEWLSPQSTNKNSILEILKQKENVRFNYSWVM